MSEAGAVMTAFIAGFALGFAVGVVLLRRASPPQHVVFDRDQSGRIVGIHYVPGST